MRAEEFGSSTHAMDFFSPLAEEDDIPDMPCFECSNVGDRPLAPEADEYPLGCEVELRDKDYARHAQEESRWDPFLDEIFAVPRRRVKVCRHSEDYTFVLCYDVKGYDVVGFTLYRACLSEPKVKTTKYYAEVAARDEDDFADARQGEGGGRSVFGLDDVFRQPVGRENFPPPPWLATDKRVAVPNDVAAAPGATAGKPAEDREGTGKRHQLDLYDTNDAPPRLMPPNSPQMVPSTAKLPNGQESRLPPQQQQGSNVNGSGGNGAGAIDANVHSPSRMTSNNVGQVRRRTKFANLMKNGTEELERGNYDRALSYYNRALQEAPEEEARVLSSRSVAYLMLNRTDEAIKDAEAVVALTPKSFLGYLRKANVLRSMKHYRDAQTFYKTAQCLHPDNSTIRKLLLSNSVSMLYDVRTKRFPAVKMIFDEANTRVALVARRDIKKDDVVLKETSPVGAMYSAQYSYVMESDPSGTTVCHNCAKPIFNETNMCLQIPGMQPETFHLLCKDQELVPCSQKCHSVYCSEDCRSKAWAFHHWVECGKNGRWRDGVKELHQYLDEYIVKHTSAESATSSAAKASSVVEDLSPMVVASTIRIAARMFSRMLSGVWPLRDAIHMFDWLQVSPVVEAQSEEVRSVLTNAYSLLSASFRPEEKSKLRVELFERCYKRAKSNAVTLQLSTWNNIALRAESLLNFVDADASTRPCLNRSIKPPGAGSRNADSSITEAESSHASRNSAIAGTSLSEDQKRALEFVARAPPEGIPGTIFTVLGLFEIYAPTGVTNLTNVRHQQPSGQSCGRRQAGRELVNAQTLMPTPNLVIQSSPEPSMCLHVRATRAIKRGETLVTAPPRYISPEAAVAAYAGETCHSSPPPHGA